jgi:hypothetical protein
VEPLGAQRLRVQKIEGCAYMPFTCHSHCTTSTTPVYYCPLLRSKLLYLRLGPGSIPVSHQCFNSLHPTTCRLHAVIAA